MKNSWLKTSQPVKLRMAALATGKLSGIRPQFRLLAKNCPPDCAYRNRLVALLDAKWVGLR